MKIVKDKIEISELKEMAKDMYVDMVKVMVDIEKEIIAVNAEMHSDLLEFLIQEEDSEPKDLWGINIYFDGDEFIKFHSVMNYKPSLGNRSQNIEDKKIKEKIIKIINVLVKK